MIGTVRSRISHFMNELGTLGYMKCEGKAGNPKIPIDCTTSPRSVVGSVRSWQSLRRSYLRLSAIETE
jgi:hypothetical protein